MKVFAVILSIYVLALTLVPCVDNLVDAYSNLTELVPQDNNSHSSDLDMCSPFCPCNCCHVNSIVSLKIIMKSAETVPSLFVSIYNVSPLKDIILTIWQPPKI